MFAKFLLVALVVAIVAFSSVATAATTKITLSIRDLPSKDPDNGAPNTFINAYYAPSATAPYQLLGKTNYVSDNKNPDFSEIFEVPDNGDSKQALKFDIFGMNSADVRDDDYIGYVWILMTDVLKGKNGVASKNIWGTKGNLYIKFEQ